METNSKRIDSSKENITYKTGKHTPKPQQKQKMENVQFQKFLCLVKNAYKPLYRLV